jgi:hypothetical protein
LAALEEGLPDGHDAALAGTPPPMPEPLARYWAAYHRAARATPNPLVYAQGAAQRHGLQARTDIAVLDAIRRLDETEA